MGHSKITIGRPAFNEHERKSRETRPRAVESQPFITWQSKFARK